MTTVLTDSYGQALFGAGGSPLTVEVSGDLWSLPPGPGSQAFFVVELDVFQSSSGVTQPFALGRLSHPRGAVTLYPQTSNSSTTLYASDMGYRSRATDTIGVRPYPAVMDQAFEIDRLVGLAPGQTSTASAGAVRLSNLGRRYDSFTQGRNSDSRSIRLLMGNKTYDQSRGLYVDPSYANLTPFFVGTALSWTLSEDELEIPLRDATYWAADRPLQSSLYTGTGGLNGGSDLAGKPIPMVRGGTAANPVQNVPLTTVDAVNLIFQYTDFPGTVVNLYEGGATVFVNDGDIGFTSIYSGTPPAPGHYRTCNALGLVQMGSTPVRALTADVTGSFPVSGAISTAAAIAKWVLLDTLGLPSSMIDTASFDAADSTYPWVAGFYAGNGEQGLDTIRFLLESIGARLITSRSGKLSVLVLRSAVALFAPLLSTANCTSVTPATLTAPLDPPAYRWRVGYNKSWLVQTSDYNGSIAAARKAVIATDYQLATWSSDTVQAQWRRPSDPAPVGTALLSQGHAQLLANAYGALWGPHPTLWTIEMPITAAVGLDLGTIVQVQWPLSNFSTPTPGQIVGEQVRSFDSTTRFTVLIGNGTIPGTVDTVTGSATFYSADSTSRTADSSTLRADAA
jgi:hypothetical protein